MLERIKIGGPNHSYGGRLPSEAVSVSLVCTHSRNKDNTIDWSAVQRRARNCCTLPVGGVHVIGAGSGCVAFNATLSSSPRYRSCCAAPSLPLHSCNAMSSSDATLSQPSPAPRLLMPHCLHPLPRPLSLPGFLLADAFWSRTFPGSGIPLGNACGGCIQGIEVNSFTVKDALSHWISRIRFQQDPVIPTA